MPREILIDGLVIDDRNHPKDYKGPYLFSDPDGREPATAARPFPYRLTERVTLRNVTTTSGRPVQTSPDAAFSARVRAKWCGRAGGQEMRSALGCDGDPSPPWCLVAGGRVVV
jgi:hypothetical protein